MLSGEALYRMDYSDLLKTHNASKAAGPAATSPPHLNLTVLWCKGVPLLVDIRLLSR